MQNLNRKCTLKAKFTFYYSTDSDASIVDNPLSGCIAFMAGNVVKLHVRNHFRNRQVHLLRKALEDNNVYKRDHIVFIDSITIDRQSSPQVKIIISSTHHACTNQTSLETPDDKDSFTDFETEDDEGEGDKNVLEEAIKILKTNLGIREKKDRTNTSDNELKRYVIPVRLVDKRFVSNLLMTAKFPKVTRQVSKTRLLQEIYCMEERDRIDYLQNRLLNSLLEISKYSPVGRKLNLKEVVEIH